MFKTATSLYRFVITLSLLNLVLFHYPFYAFVVTNADCTTASGLLLVASLVILMIVANAFAFFLVYFLLRFIGKLLIALSFLISSVAVYFINYGVIIDESMIGNILNTNYEESSSFFSFKLVLYFLVLGVAPSIYIFRAKVALISWKKFLVSSSAVIVFMLVMAFANAANWLWIDKNSKTLGGLAMPWSYYVNTSLYYVHQAQKNQKEILLPDAVIKDRQKSVVVLVIGESARSANFSLYGYKKNTNPKLAATENVHHYKAISCATYTTAGVKCILEHTAGNDLYEILPNYLYRNGVDVIWRTTNWGEPPVHIEKYQRRGDLLPGCEGEKCDYDEVLLTGLKEQILASNKDKVLIILHTSTSHGPTYGKKYPKQFETFTPVCNSVELAQCSQDELVNAYDNTIVYTDHILSEIITDLKALEGYQSTMIFVSDHGESLGWIYQLN